MQEALALIDLSLPYPPTVNTYWRHCRGMHFISAAGKAFRANVVAEVLHTLGRDRRLPLEGPLSIQIELRRPDKRCRDLDNTLKALLDGLGHAGIYRDDSQIVQINVAWGESQPPYGATLVRIKQLPEPQLKLL